MGDEDFAMGDFSGFGLDAVLSSVDPSLRGSASGLGSLIGGLAGFNDVEMEDIGFMDDTEAIEDAIGATPAAQDGESSFPPPFEEDYESIGVERKEQKSLYDYFPDFSPDKILNFTELFGPKTQNPLLGAVDEEEEEEEEDEFGIEFDEDEWEKWRDRKRRRVVDDCKNPELLTGLSDPQLALSTRDILFKRGRHVPPKRPLKPAFFNGPGMSTRVVDLKNTDFSIPMPKDAEGKGTKADTKKEVREELHDGGLTDLVKERKLLHQEEQRVYKEVERLQSENHRPWTFPEKQHGLLVNEQASNEAEPYIEDWESQIVWKKPMQDQRTLKERSKDILNATNPLLDVLPWENSIIWDRRLPFTPFSQLEINLNDPSVFLGLSSTSQAPQTVSNVVSRIRSLGGGEKEVDRFNLSNDRVYEASREWAKSLALMEKGGRYGAIRQTLGNLDIEHSYVAEKLQLPWYKARLSKSECRSFHRPPLQFPLHVTLTFSRSRAMKLEKGANKRKRFRGNTSMQRGGGKDGLLNRSKHLTLKDTGNFVLMEFSEEYPMIMSNFGMGSMIVNYYRKTGEGDETVPQLEIGEPFVLDINDENPFMRFGSVEPGQTVPTLYNNLIRAPLFRHTAYSTDFLVVRATHGSESRYYIREIKHLYVVGQTYPMKEVPGPNSRRLNNGFKDRLKTIAWKLLKKNQTDSLKIGKFLKYFPDQSELQMRGKLKDFMEYHRKGVNLGQWRLKVGQRFDEYELQKLEGNNPEFVCLAESMQVGQRHLLDSGYGMNDMDEKEGEERDGEHQLSPWMLSKNFLTATQSKATVKLYGDGDPSGRGEAFSFVKGNFTGPENASQAKSARYSAATQQQMYRAEIERIWKAQFRSLSDTLEPHLTEEDERRFRAVVVPMIGPARRTTAIGTPSSNTGTPLPYDYPSVGSRDGSPDRYEGMSPNVNRGQEPLGHDEGKVLKIRRWINGVMVKETVRDPFVINAYKRERLIVEEEMTQAETLNPSDDHEKNRIYRKRIEEQISKLKRNQDRRMLRRKQIEAREAGAPIPSGRQKQKETSRKCGHCGGVGHMKTNKKCPMWAKYNLTDNVGASSMPSPSPAIAGTPYSLAPPLAGSPPAGTPNPITSPMP